MGNPEISPKWASVPRWLRKPTEQPEPLETKHQGAYSYLYGEESARWSRRDYESFAQEAYQRNVIAYRCISMIARMASSVPWQLVQRDEYGQSIIHTHPLLDLLNRPNMFCSGNTLLEMAFGYRLISGNVFLQKVTIEQDAFPTALHVLRPDRVKIIFGRRGFPVAYRYQVNDQVKEYPINPVTGESDILHLRHFHPLDSWSGMSPVEAAAYSIDQHNAAAKWNQSLLQRGARPSGALIVEGGKEGYGGRLSETQYARLKQQIDEAYSGAQHAGRPLLLEGGLQWKEMSLSPKDMDFLDAKNSAARDIALAFGVPPQLLGIPGDNTYSNFQEARLSLWEDTIIPMLDNLKAGLNQWLIPEEEALTFCYNLESVPALSARRDLLWKRINNADFLTMNEKREAVGLSPIEE